MSIFTEQEAKAILDKVIALSKADECTATLATPRSHKARTMRSATSPRLATRTLLNMIASKSGAACA